ncbi:hypothetical protein J1605_020300 [Eschrichtius robustus]|uniref:Uncharacterized protein n=1 Tax=Eschrichtius robustus TaxID=9764 RepID=A0AB34HK57_ESCRO|nr:hypothetical protein J1605_020300 [Eschrichtius robustus]
MKKVAPPGPGVNAHLH